MDAQVPAVVAVVVTTGRGPWLDETLASLASQTYEELSVLVLGTDDAFDPTVRVGRRAAPCGHSRPRGPS